MDPVKRPSVTVCRRGSADPVSDPLRTVVQVRGDHEYATQAQLSESIARAAGLDDTDIVVDLSGVTFMDASTISTLVRARNCLHTRLRALTLVAPSPLARRLLDVCGLTFLIEDDRAPARPSGSTALDSWVAVPASDRAPEPRAPEPRAPESTPPPPTSPRAPSRVPSDATAPPRVEAAGSGHQGRTPP